jgi:hypothetical protein
MRQASPRLKAAYVGSALLVLVVSGFYFLRSTGEGRRGLPSSTGASASTTTSTPAAPPRTNEQRQSSVTDTEMSSSFYHAKACYEANFRAKHFKGFSDCDSLASRPGLEGAYAECLKNWDDAQRLVGAAQRSSASLHCGDDEHHLFRDYYDSTKEAAKRGNTDAQLCYLQSNFLDSGNPQQYTQAEIADYQASSAKYISEAFARGDWRIVKLLSSGHHGEIVGLMLYIPDIGTPETMYKMNMLLRLGADGEYANELDAAMEMIAQPDGHENPDLPENKIDEANAWAQKTYSQYFASAPRLSKDPYPCNFAVRGPDTQ